MWDISWPSYHHVSGISWHDEPNVPNGFGLSAGRDDVKTWPWMMWDFFKGRRSPCDMNQEILTTAYEAYTNLYDISSYKIKQPRFWSLLRILFKRQSHQIDDFMYPHPRKWTNVLWKGFKRKSHVPTINFQLRTASFQTGKPSQFFIMTMANSAGSSGRRFGHEFG